MTGADLTAFVKKHPVSVGCGLLALVFALTVYFRAAGVPEAETLLEERSGEAGRLSTNIKHAAQLNEQLAALAAAGRAIEPRLIRSGELATNLQYFYRLEADTGTKLMELRQNPPPATRPASKTLFVPVSFSLTVEGGYPAVLDFLRRLEAGTHYCRVQSAVLRGVAPVSGRSDTVRLALSFELLGSS
jgi:hypothetical protein